ncbi:MAG: serine protease [Nitrospira sp.]|nr:serine protease [Nitrospira sp.]
MIWDFSGSTGSKVLVYHILICLLFTGAVGCTYKGSIPSDFTIPPSRPDHKIPLKVSLVRKESPDLHGRGGPFKYEINLDPGLTAALASKLSSIFEGVSVITDVREATDTNLLAHLEVELQNKTHEFPRGEKDVPISVFYARLQLSLQDPYSKQRVSSYDVSKTFGIDMDNSAMGLTGATVLTFGLTSPITVPLATSSQGRYATTVVEEQLSQMIESISDKILKDDKRIVARLSTISETREPLNQSDQADSDDTHSVGQWQIDDLKKGVVRVTAQFEGLHRTGTGFIVRLDKHAAYIVTAAHVVEGDSKPEVTFFTDTPHSYQTKIIGMEGGNPKGLAALFMEGQLPSGLKELRLDTTAQVTGGEQVSLIGFPLPAAIPWTVTNGSISGLNGRDLAFQAPVEEGNSGGPLFLNGTVVGVIVEGRGQYGYAVPTSMLTMTLRGWQIRTENNGREK